jgi:hypothetical protein
MNGCGFTTTGSPLALFAAPLLRSGVGNALWVHPSR